MASGDLSPCTRMYAGPKRVEAVYGDESPDAINQVPTLVAWLGEGIRFMFDRVVDMG